MAGVTHDLLGAMFAASQGKEWNAAGWLSAAKKRPELAAALESMLGKKLTAKRLGCWLSKNIGLRAGDSELIATHCAKKHAWRYAIRVHVPAPKPGPWGAALVEEAEIQGTELTVLPQDVDRIVTGNGSQEAAEKRKERADLEAQRQADRDKLRADPEARAVIREWKAIRDGRAVVRTRVDRDGRVIEEVMRDRDGAPLREVTAKAPDPAQHTLGTKPRSQKQIRDEEGRDWNRDEWNAWQAYRGARHTQRTAPANIPRVNFGPAAEPMDGVANLDGTRPHPGGSSTLWDRTLKNL